uniref:Methyltransferase domain-containing protein n=1 Tax=Arion vulgaris TaxID=1028688 RepID=A0A0B7A262_9EUPU
MCRLADKSKPLSYLDLGCGTSSLAGNILTNSPTPVLLVLLDFVSEALHYQKQYISTCTALIPESSCQLVCADVMFLPFGDGCFNIAVDKGTMDALLKDKVNGHSKAQVMMSEVRRVLAPGGRFLQISDEDPDTRLLFLEQLNKVNSSHVLTEQTTLDAQLLGDNCESFVGSTHCQTARTLPVSKQLSSWSFKVIPTSWNKEYFILWSDNHH